MAKFRIGTLLVAGVIAWGASLTGARADSVDSPPVLAAQLNALKLQRIEGVYWPPGRTTSSVYIADASWQLCGVRGAQGVGEGEQFYIYQSGTGQWYVHYQHWDWTHSIWWYCVK